MAEPFLGQIIMFGGNFAPRGWAFCDGQLLQISQNSALFSLLGTMYGGDGRTTFGLPDLRGRSPIHAGTGPGLSPRSLGQKGGAETVVLNANQLPAHTHTLYANNGQPDESNPQDGFPATLTNDTEGYAESSNTTMNSNVVSSVGGGQSHNNMPPFQTVNFIIALQGIYPSRS